MSSHIAYGLNIHSELLLPELLSSEGDPDVIVRFSERKIHTGADCDAGRNFSRTAGGSIRLSWAGIGTFLVRDGCEIEIDPATRVNEQILRLVILGPALGILLLQRGLSVFHASAVATEMGGIAFMARKGHGKSTMAAAMIIQGYDLLADDIMAIDFVDDCPMVRPAFPQTKLWPETLEALGEAPHSLPQLHPDLEKRAKQVPDFFARETVPLRCVFLLSVGDELAISHLAPRDALLGVLPHWYGALFDGELLDSMGTDVHFHQCLRLVNQVPVYDLKRPASLWMLPEITRLLVQFLVDNFSGIQF